MLKRFYDRVMALAAHRNAKWWLALISCVESSIFPIPPDVMLIPMVLARRTDAWRIAAVCALASVAGGCAGYAIGFFLFDAVGRPLLEFFGARITPFPYKVITIASGVTGLGFLVFTIASLRARGLRFFFVTALLWYFGEPIRGFIERHLGKLTVLFFVLLLGGFVIVKYIV